MKLHILSTVSFSGFQTMLVIGVRGLNALISSYYFRQCSLFPPTINTLRRRQNGRRFPDDIFKCIFLNENVWILIKVSLKFVPKGSIDNISALVKIMAWRRPGDKPLFEPIMVSLPTHICVTQPQWVNSLTAGDAAWHHGTFVNIPVGNNILPVSIKSPYKPMVIYHQRGLLAFICEHLHR